MSTRARNALAVAVGPGRAGPGRVVERSAGPQPAPLPLGDMVRARVVAALRALFNGLALNLVLVACSAFVVTLPVAVNAAVVALERWRVDGEDRVVREFLHALKSRPVGRTTVAVGAPLAGIATAAEEVHFFSRGGAPVSWVCLGFGVAALVILMGLTGYVIVLSARHPETFVLALWSEAARLAVTNLFVSGPAFAVEYGGVLLLGLLDPALVLIGLPLACLALVRLTAGAGARRGGYGPAPNEGRTG